MMGFSDARNDIAGMYWDDMLIPTNGARNAKIRWEIDESFALGKNQDKRSTKRTRQL